MVIAYASLGLIGFFVYRLGAIWFDRWIGAVAAAIVLTRAPFLSNGLRAYIDLPYIALCLAALLVEAKRPRAGWPVLALLALAGLLRPEAWLFSFAYLGYLAIDPDRWSGGPDPEHRSEEREKAPLERADTQRAGLIRPALVRARGAFSLPPLWLIVLAVAGPVLWVLFDAITAGDPLYSWTGTKETVETLERQTGPVDLVLYGPRRLGEVLQWPGMVGAFGGVALGLAFLRRRSALGVAAAGLALLAFALLACGGLAILPRYTMLAAAVLAIFAALALLGWRLLEPGPPLAPALAGLRRPRRADVRRSGCRTSGTSTRASTPTSPTRPGSRVTSPTSSTPAPSSRSAARSPSPTTAPSPASPSASTSSPTQIVSASEEAVPARGYFVAPASPSS